MSTPYERELRARLRAAEIELALADRPDVRKTARRDLSRRLIDLGADVRSDGSILFEAGGGLEDALAQVRATDGAHLFSDTVVPANKPEMTGLSPGQKLALVNEGAAK